MTQSDQMVYYPARSPYPPLLSTCHSFSANYQLCMTMYMKISIVWNKECVVGVCVLKLESLSINRITVSDVAVGN